MGKSLFLVPSTYGLLGWLIAIFFIAIDPVGMQPLTWTGYFIIAYTLFVYAAMTYMFQPSFAEQMRADKVRVRGMDMLVFAASSVLGLYGLLSYVNAVTGHFGGFANLAFTLGNSALDIRANAEEFAGASIQLTYFSWLSIFIGALIIDSRRHFGVRALVLAIILFEIFLNLFFVDRTRPVWIIFTTALGVIAARGIINAKINRNAAYLFAAPALIFVVFSYIVGKFNEDFGIFGTMSAYIMSGIGYIDDLAASQLWTDYEPIRTFLPIAKAFETLGFVHRVPSGVLVDRFIPFPTNVGTIHEPYFSDGGMVYLVIFFPVLVIFTNFVALVGLKTHRAIGLFAWAHCIFSLMISFFVPKFNTTPFYFVMLVFLAFMVGYKPERRRRPQQRHGHGTIVYPPKQARRLRAIYERQMAIERVEMGEHDQSAVM